MTSVMNIALGGMNRNAIGVATVANNVANVGTDGYRAQRYDQATGTTSPRYDDAPAVVDPASGVAPSDVDLATELVDMKSLEVGYQANVAVLKIAQDMNGALLDLLA